MEIHSAFHALPPNDQGRDFVVGDVHGQLPLLEALLSKVTFNPVADRLIALGDLVDRGNGSARLLEWVHDKPWFYSLCGNHELMMIEALSDPLAERLWEKHGNAWTRALAPGQLKALAACVAGMPLAMELALADGRRIGLVHAEVPRGMSWTELKSRLTQDDYATQSMRLVDSLLWGRSRFMALSLRFGKKARPRPAGTDEPDMDWRIGGIDLVISGHNILDQRLPMPVLDMLYLDTGGFESGGRLTMLEPVTRKYWQSFYPLHAVRSAGAGAGARRKIEVSLRSLA